MGRHYDYGEEMVEHLTSQFPELGRYSNDVLVRVAERFAAQRLTGSPLTDEQLVAVCIAHATHRDE